MKKRLQKVFHCNNINDTFVIMKAIEIYAGFMNIVYVDQNLKRL